MLFCMNYFIKIQRNEENWSFKLSVVVLVHSEYHKGLCPGFLFIKWSLINISILKSFCKIKINIGIGGKNNIIRENILLSRKKLFYPGKNDTIPEKIILSRKVFYYPGKNDSIQEVDCIFVLKMLIENLCLRFLRVFEGLETY